MTTRSSTTRKTTTQTTNDTDVRRLRKQREKRDDIELLDAIGSLDEKPTADPVGCASCDDDVPIRQASEIDDYQNDLVGFEISLPRFAMEPRRPKVRSLELVNEPGEWFTLEQVCELLDVTPATVHAAMELRGGVIEGLTFRWIEAAVGRPERPRQEAIPVEVETIEPPADATNVAAAPAPAADVRERSSSRKLTCDGYPGEHGIAAWAQQFGIPASNLYATISAARKKGKTSVEYKGHTFRGFESSNGAAAAPATARKRVMKAAPAETPAPAVAIALSNEELAKLLTALSRAGKVAPEHVTDLLSWAQRVKAEQAILASIFETTPAIRVEGGKVYLVGDAPAAAGNGGSRPSRKKFRS